MTDRYNTLTVVLERDIRDDDARPILDAIAQIRGVLKVSGNIASPESWMAEERAKREIGEKLWAVLHPKS